jgi:asparagine synthase (glutamine-hydrolysing)
MHPEAMNQTFVRLRGLLDNAVKADLAQGILLSGGLDTSIVALIAKRYVPQLMAFTVSLEGYDNKDRDLEYAQKVAQFLNLEHKIYFFNEEEMLSAAEEVMNIINCEEFTDLAGYTTVVPTYIALKLAKRYVDSVYTGVGADEFFMGYSSMVEMALLLNEDDEFYTSEFRSNFQKELSSIVQTFDLSYASKLGEAVGLKVKSPYLNGELIEYAQALPFEYKVKIDAGKVWGKWILRKAFEQDLPKEIIWRKKVPIDQGTGAIKLLDLLDV